MKTRLSAWSAAPLIIWGLSLGLILEIAPVATGGVPGELDVSFQPPPEYQQDFPKLTVDRGWLYVTGQTVGSPYRRLNEDGSIDLAWEFPAPVQTIYQYKTTAEGGWMAADPFVIYRGLADGSFEKVFSAANRVPGDPFYPQADGSLLVHGTMNGIFRLDSEMHRVRSVGLAGEWERINPPSPVTLWSAQDSRGRIVVGGNFIFRGGLERIGLVRLLSDGRPDPDWNPGPALGLGATNGDGKIYLTSRPVDVVAGTNGSVLVNFNGGPLHQQSVVISSSGEVVAQFPDDPGTWARAVQPDGRILIGGVFSHWGGTPATGLIRLNGDGTPDPTFQATLDSPVVKAMTLDERGRLWFSGTFTTVNGTPRKGLARVFAYEPVPAAPQLEMAARKQRVATNEVLRLTANVVGFPAPELQWYRGSQPIPGATNRGLWFTIHTEADLGTFRLVASNPLGTNELSFGLVEPAVRSPQPGVLDPDFVTALTEVPGITKLIPLADGGALFGAGNIYMTQPQALLGRVRPDGSLDPQFGDGGLVRGVGVVEDLQLLPDGGVLVAGALTELDGAPASGLAELDTAGRRVARAFPTLDIPHVTAALRLPDGRTMLAGRFEKVGNLNRFRLARLTAQLAPDPSFTASLEPWQIVDAMALDLQGRLLIAGERTWYLGSMSDPSLVGLMRLQEDGSADPGFPRVTTAAREIVVEPDGSYLVAGVMDTAGRAPSRWDVTGRSLTEFQWDGNSRMEDLISLPGHRLVRFSDGSVVLPTGRTALDYRLTRWRADGKFDDNFAIRLSPNNLPTFAITAAAALSDDSIWLATQEYFNVGDPYVTFLRRVPADPDSRLADPSVVGGEFRASLFTQPGRTYQVRSRPSLNAGDGSPVAELIGDGYRSDVAIPGAGGEGFLELRRE